MPSTTFCTGNEFYPFLDQYCAGSGTSDSFFISMQNPSIAPTHPLMGLLGNLLVANAAADCRRSLSFIGNLLKQQTLYNGCAYRVDAHVHSRYSHTTANNNIQIFNSILRAIAACQFTAIAPGMERAPISSFFSRCSDITLHRK